MRHGRSQARAPVARKLCLIAPQERGLSTCAGNVRPFPRTPHNPGRSVGSTRGCRRGAERGWECICLRAPALGRGLPGQRERQRAALLQLGPVQEHLPLRCAVETHAVHVLQRAAVGAGGVDAQALAVAQVILNRVKSGLYPSSVCGVVYQNRHRFMGCQFSFACEGKSLRITDAESWRSATRVASAVIDGRTYVSEVGGATHYHADYVRPGWSRRLKRKDMIGRHIFYQLKPNQT